MSFLSFFGCQLNRHVPRRREVTWNGRNYVGECRHCGAPIQRHGRHHWRRRRSSAESGESTPTPS